MAVERFITESGSLSLEQMGSQTSPVRVYFVVALDESPQISCEVQFAEESGLGNVESLVCPYVSSIEGEHFYSCTYKPLLYLYLTGDENNQDSDLCIENNTTVTDANGKLILNGETVHGRFALNVGEYNLVVAEAHPIRLIDNDTSKIRITGQFTHTNGSSNVGYHGNVVISVYEDFGTISYECTKHGAMGGTDNLIFNTKCKLGEPIIPTPTPSPSATPSPSVTLDSGPQGPSGEGYTFSTKADLQTAVNAWNDDSISATETYGDINTWDVSAITNMALMFNNKTNITSLDLSGWDTSNVTITSAMFQGCSSLTSITFGINFDTSNVEYMNGMFYECNNLISLDLSNFDTSSVTNMANMFSYCSSLTSITFGEIFSGDDMNWMFQNCSALTSLDLSSFDTSSVTGMTGMFVNCSALTSITFGDNFDTSDVTSMGFMFHNCSSLTSLDISGWCVTQIDYVPFRFTENAPFANDPSNLPNWGYCPVTGVISGATNIGDDTLNVSNSAEFTIGDQLVIDRGTSSEETTTIIDKGSLVIYPALTKSHADNATVESRPAVPSPTPSPSPSPTPSLSPSPTPSPSPSPTPSPSVTPSPSPSVTPSPSPSPTPSPTESPTYVETYIDDPSPTPSPTESPTYVETYIDDPSPTPSPSVTPSPTITTSPSPSPSATETPTPVPFNMKTVDFTDPDLIFYVSISNIQGAYYNNGKTLVGNFNQNDNTSLSNEDGLILGNTTSSAPYMNHLRYVIQVDLIDPVSSDIKTWASSFDAPVELGSSTNSLGGSYNVPGFILFGTKADASQFDGYILHDIKIDEKFKTSSSYPGAEFTLNLYSHSSSSNLYNGVKLGTLLYTTSTCGTLRSPVTSHNNQAGYWWSVTSRSWDAN